MGTRLHRIDEAFQQNPTMFIAAAAGFMAGAAKLVSAIGHARGSYAYAQDVKRRDRQSQKSQPRGRK